MGVCTSLSSSFSKTLDGVVPSGDSAAALGLNISLDNVLARPRVGVGIDSVDGSYLEKEVVVFSLEGLAFPNVVILLP